LLEVRSWVAALGGFDEGQQGMKSREVVVPPVSATRFKAAVGKAAGLGKITQIYAMSAFMS
jgi:hypothetical protein